VQKTNLLDLAVNGRRPGLQLDRVHLVGRLGKCQPQVREEEGRQRRGALEVKRL
jgi:hypothetical protein